MLRLALRTRQLALAIEIYAHDIMRDDEEASFIYDHGQDAEAIREEVKAINEALEPEYVKPWMR